MVSKMDSNLTEDEFVALARCRTDRVILVLDRIVDFFNLQSICRVADMFGLSEVWLSTSRK